MARLSEVRKFIAALVTAVVITGGAYATDGTITGSEWLLIAFSVLGSGAVWGVRNDTGTKKITSGRRVRAE